MLVEEYRGFQIKKGLDSWGDESFAVYDGLTQMFDVVDTLEEAKEDIDNYLEGDR